MKRRERDDSSVVHVDLDGSAGLEAYQVGSHSSLLLCRLDVLCCPWANGRPKRRKRRRDNCSYHDPQYIAAPRFRVTTERGNQNRGNDKRGQQEINNIEPDLHQRGACDKINKKGRGK